MAAFCGVVRMDDEPADADEAASMAGAFAAAPGGRPTLRRDRAGAFAAVSLPLTPEDRFDRQPWTGRDGRITLLFDGRLDDRAGLIDRLGLDGKRAEGMADGALVAAAYERWGTAILAGLAGFWVLAVWDAAARRLVLARDPMGGRSLFYHRQGPVITFAASTLALLRLPRVERVLDETVLGDLLMLTMGERDRTFYRDISRVPSAHLVVCTPEGTVIDPFWHPPVGGELRLPRDEDYVEAARELLERAVRANLRSLRPVAVLGSGGLDSAGVAATAARLLAPRPLPLYCRVPPTDWSGPELSTSYPDERPKLAALAALHPNLRVMSVEQAGPHRFDEDQTCLFQRYGLAARAADNIGWLLGAVDQARAAGHRVLLTGDYGNTTLSAPGRGAPMALLRQGRLMALARELAGWRRQRGWSWPKVARETLLYRIPGLSPLRSLGRNPGSWRSWTLTRPEAVRALGLEARARAAGAPGFPMPTTTPAASRALILERYGRLRGDLAAQTTAVDGFELRSPLAYLPLVEFTLRVPSPQFCRDGRLRWLARRTLADRLPPEILMEDRLGAQHPEWFDTLSSLRESYQADLPRLAKSPLVATLLDLERAGHLLDSWPDIARDAAPRHHDHALALVRGLHVARFVRWNEGGND
ncbi:asparagine synthetase B family protein [Rhodospirillum rubrum]|uniref:asparagine synthase (glutamine-hydrolyzing) n=1 Tax=Rhodospirillum rubrum (strain ATCC 11170 / ATH 1.1.1 / DSM 467 / LMG 4362 / NCIMB 8255 / S1) TaxID=269796 RepID=Q2RW39_RHORT|nr:asparagine synthetase B [Rhodospirillum rubrum]ABC21656.1 Asparagine synthase [Rhodospirillum rubrum ATCC 11170]AEO47353.1 asparagine synthase [Rhodospirillum rubrum F11]MBK5953208.1 asparagine synthetase B [Rhodospirillum rubrum]QXG81322.1 asparagine synthetase B [Rhodospirillum rubrum]HAP98644.1 asparagine synthetase B [Rhodospirillum rubrum]